MDMVKAVVCTVLYSSVCTAFTILTYVSRSADAFKDEALLRRLCACFDWRVGRDLEYGPTSFLVSSKQKSVDELHRLCLLALPLHKLILLGCG